MDMDDGWVKFSTFEYEDDDDSSLSYNIEVFRDSQETIFPNAVKQNINKDLNRKRRDPVPVDDSGSSPNAHVPQPENRVPEDAVQNINDNNGERRRSARLQRKMGNMPAERSPTQQQAIDIRSNVERNHFENSGSTGTLNVLDKWVDVLEEIFKHCSVKDLKNCRLVCRLWRDVSFLTWRSYGYATISPDTARRNLSEFQMFLSDYHPHLAALGQIREVPFTNYKLFKEDFPWLYQNWGCYLKCLTFVFVVFRSQNDFIDIIFKYCQNLENLNLIRVKVTHAAEKTEGTSKAEIIDWNRFQTHNQLKSMCLDAFKWEGVAWMEFLHLIPSLQSLSLDRSVSNSEELFQSLEAIRKRNPNNLNLKTVHLQGQNISSAILSVLLDPRLDLQSFELREAIFRDLNTSLPKIIANNTQSLKKLVIVSVGSDSDTTAINNFQLSSENQLENLQELNITYNSVKYSLAGFLKVAPNLRKLVFMGASASDLGIGDVSNAADIKLNYCSEMEIDVSSFSNEDLEHLIRWIPNLQKLQITGLNNELFSMVCNGWPNLVRLDALRCSGLDDSGITGLDIEDVNIINRNGNGKNGDWRPITVPRPNITSLKGLRKLNLKAIVGGRSWINYCTAACGINQLYNLEYLKIENFKLGGQRWNTWGRFSSRSESNGMFQVVNIFK